MTANDSTRSTGKEHAGCTDCEAERRQGLATAADDVEAMLEELREELEAFQLRLNTGDTPSGDDLLRIQRTLHHAADRIVTATEPFVEDEPVIVRELRNLGRASNRSLLHAAATLNDESQLNRSLYLTARAELICSLAVYDEIDVAGGVAAAGTETSSVDLHELAEATDVLDEIEDATVVRTEGNDGSA